MSLTKKSTPWTGQPEEEKPEPKKPKPRDYLFKVYEREDGLWAWKLVAPNGRIIATDAGQGFRDKHDAERSVSLTRIAAGSKRWKDSG